MARSRQPVVVSKSVVVYAPGEKTYLQQQLDAFFAPRGEVVNKAAKTLLDEKEHKARLFQQ